MPTPRDYSTMTRIGYKIQNLLRCLPTILSGRATILSDFYTHQGNVRGFYTIVITDYWESILV